jgi:microcystin degradation protein MlrC
LIQVFDDNWMIAHGIVTCQFRLIALKSVVHFRAFFTPARVSEVIISDGQPGLTSHNMEPFVKKRNLEAVWPTDLSVTWDPRGRGLEVVKAKI